MGIRPKHQEEGSSSDSLPRKYKARTSIDGPPISSERTGTKFCPFWHFKLQDRPSPPHWARNGSTQWALDQSIKKKGARRIRYHANTKLEPALMGPPSVRNELEPNFALFGILNYKTDRVHHTGRETAQPNGH